VRARPHRCDGDVLAHPPGDEDERQVGVDRADDLQRVDPAERRQVVVGDHDVPALAQERGAQVVRIFDDLVVGREACLAQRDELELDVVGRVLDEQDADARLAHVSASSDGG
jgi:hypothetical protein